VDDTLEILKDPESLAKRAAEVFLSAAAQLRPNTFTVALAGGKQQPMLYRLLSSESWRDRVDWHRIQFFFGDERAVHPDHPDSNYRLALESLFRPLNISASQVHRMKGEMEDLTEAALLYANELKPLAVWGVPQFDLVLLGLGSDGHTASLFPRSAALKERERWVVPVLDAPKPPPRRLTLTVPVLNAARQVLFVVSGSDKASAVHEVLQGTAAEECYPAKFVRPGPNRLLWLLDQAAASGLKR